MFLAPAPGQAERPTPFPGYPPRAPHRGKAGAAPLACLGGCAKDGLIETPRLNLPCAIPGNGKHQPIRVAKKLERASNLPKQNKPATDT